MRAWKRSKWAMVAIANWPTFSAWTRTPWPADDTSCSCRTWPWSTSAERAAGASLWKKNARNSRGHHEAARARYRGRSDDGAEVDPQDAGEDRTPAPGARASGLGHDGRASPLPDGVLAPCQ